MFAIIKETGSFSNEPFDREVALNKFGHDRFAEQDVGHGNETAVDQPPRDEASQSCNSVKDNHGDAEQRSFEGGRVGTKQGEFTATQAGIDIFRKQTDFAGQTGLGDLFFQRGTQVRGGERQDELQVGALSTKLAGGAEDGWGEAF